jgi:ubiquinone biosynthesis accessory factor UbiK
MMFDPKTIDEMAHRLAGAVTPGILTVKGDVEKTFRAILQGSIAKLDLVTREEFEVQKLVLAKTRSKLEALEKRVADMERYLINEADR